MSATRIHKPAFATQAGIVRLALAAATLLASHAALAAGPQDVDQGARGRDVEASLQDGKASTWTLGLGAAYAPRYEGSSENRLYALPLVGYQRGRFSVGYGGVTYDLSNTRNWKFGPLLSYDRGRDENDADHLRGFGDIDGGAEVGAFVRWSPSAWSFDAELKRGVGNDVEGTRLKLAVGHTTVLGKADRLLLGASTEWADDRYSQAYFGVDAGQSLRSGLPVYSVDAGIKGYAANVAWVHAFNASWFSTLGLRVERLSGDAANSPIVQDATASSVTALVGYRF